MRRDAADRPPESLVRTTRRRAVAGLASAGGLLLAGCLGFGEEHEHYTIDVVDRDTEEVVADYHGHWHGELPAVPVDEYVSLGADVVGGDGEPVPLGEDAEYRLHAAPRDDGLLEVESHGDHVHLHGEAAGETAVRFQLLDDGVAWETSESIAVTVVESDTTRQKDS